MSASKIYDKFNQLNNDGIEFEIKFLPKKISIHDIFDKFQEICDKTEVSQTINFIKEENFYSSIKELYFIDGEQQKDKKRFYSKKRILKPIFINSNNYDLKLTLSEESPIDAVDDYSLIRFKHRISFFLDEWRLDFTFVITSYSKNLETIKNIKSKLFGNKYIDLFEDNSIKKEIEFEFIGKDINQFKIDDLLNKLNIQSKSDIISILNSELNSSGDTLKKILPNAIEINKYQYFDEVASKIDEFYITDKIDGLRSILYINGQDSFYYDTQTNHINFNSDLKETIVECEKVGDIFYAYDIIKYDDESICNETFDTRIRYLYKLLDKFAQLRIKKFVKLSKENYSDELLKMIDDHDKEYETDGIIFTSSNNKYKETKFFKWKPIENTTIDFLVRKCPNELLGISPYIVKPGKTLYILFCGISIKEYKKLGLSKVKYYNKLFSFINTKYFPIQFCPSDNPNAYLFWEENHELDSKIVELIFDKEWEFIRVRNDRSDDYKKNNYYGNNFRVAEIIFRNYSNPLTKKLLTSSLQDLSKDFYFITNDSQDHKSIRKFNNYVKSQVIDRFEKNMTENSWIIDIASGKGQDLYKFIKLGARNILCIDNNENNLCEIIKRKYNYVNNTSFDDYKTSIFVKNIDINNPYIDNVTKIKNSITITKHETKLIVCNFAIHYFVKNASSINNFINFVSSLMPSNSRLIITCMNGEKIFNLLKKEKEWGDKKKYYIRSDDLGNKFSIGKEIELILPFSNGNLYKEYLVDIENIIKKFNTKKISLESRIDFKSCIDSFNLDFNSKYLLDTLDLEYLEFLECLVFWKK